MGDPIDCEGFTAEQLATARAARSNVIASFGKDTETKKLLLTVARKGEDLHMKLEDALRQVNRIGGDQAAMVAAVNETKQPLRDLIKKTIDLMDYVRIAHDHGIELAERVIAPTATYGNLSEEQMKIIKEHQKEEEKAKKEQLKEVSMWLL